MAQHEHDNNDDDELLTIASLSQLSSTLLSNGYLSSPLRLTSLFLHPSKPLSPSTLQSHQSLLREEHQAREQVTKCLWNMLSRFAESNLALERLGTKLSVLEFEFEREKARAGREERERKRIEREFEGEKARCKEAKLELERDVDAHKRTKDELNKTKLALQLVKTQAAQEGRRKETEFVALQARFLKLSSGGGGDGGLSSNGSHTTVLNIFAATQPSSFGSTFNNNRSRPAAQPTQTAVTGPDFLEEALKTCDEERGRLERENLEMRETLGEVDEWCENVSEMRLIGPHSSVTSNHDPNFFMYSSPEIFGETLHPKLHHIRTRLLTVTEVNDIDILKVKDEMGEVLEVERRKLAEERKRREEVERDLEQAKEIVKRSEVLASGFTAARLKELPPSDDEDDEEDEVPQSNKVAIVLQRAKDQAAAKIEEEKKLKKKQEAQRAKAVKDFLGELGDSPAPPSENNKKKQPSSSSSSSSSIPSRSTPNTTTYQNPPQSSSSTRPAPTNIRKPLSPLNEISETDDIPSPFLQRPPKKGLAGLLAAGASPDPLPPVSSEVQKDKRAVQVVNPILAAAKDKARKEKKRETGGGFGGLKKVSKGGLGGSGIRSLGNGEKKENTGLVRR